MNFAHSQNFTADRAELTRANPTTHTASESGRASLVDVSRLHHYFERSAQRRPDATALEVDAQRLTYRDLDIRANRFANYLLANGILAGSRIGILITRSLDMYVALLGAQKAGATFVPIDPSSPADRVQYIADDSGLDLVLTTADLRESCAAVSAPLLLVDLAQSAIEQAPPGRPQIDESGDPLAYIIYTSGSTGRPKGVEIAQSSICNFIDVVPEIYGVTPSERVYQGMTISFDFSIEEIWPTWAMGAAIVAGPTDGRRVGAGLADFLEDAAITMIYCVPTVLATLDRIIPSIRTVNVGGEACPQELVERWGGAGRRILNTYGPTETTVTCTYAELYPGKPVTIGKPLPTYSAILLDDELRPVPHGEVGEICVGGIGVARGYVNRPEQTAERFIIDPTGATTERIYRTGDLGRYTDNGEIEYRGRADSEVKVRGHRVDMAEIENVLLEDASIASAVLALLKTEGTGGELAAYVLLTDAGLREEPTVLRNRIHGVVRDKLPAYMVPDYFEVLTEIPMLPSGKADRKSLPAPVGGRLVGGTGEYVAPVGESEQRLVLAFAEVLRLPAESLSVEADLFEDLGGHSLVAASLVSRLRDGDIDGANELSILDIYANTTIRALARYTEGQALEQRFYGDLYADADDDRERSKPGWWRITTFGFAQLTSIYFTVLVTMFPLGIIYSLNGGEPSWEMIWQFVATLPFTYLGGRWLMPLLTARVLSSGIRPGTYRLYSFTHLRVWMVQRAMVQSPLTRLAGSPWAAAYLRLAGARIGRHTHIGTAQVSLPSMVRLGDASTVGYAVHLEGFIIADGAVHVGNVEVGEGATVAANCVLEGPCSLGEYSTLGGQSLLLAGQHIPANSTWAGSPAEERSGAGDPVIDMMTSCTQAPKEWPKALLPKFAMSLTALEIMPMLAMGPLLVLVWWSLLELGLVAALVATVVGGPLFVLTSCALILVMRRFALVHTPVGVHHTRSQLGMEKWLGDKLFELSLELCNPLFGTLYTPTWLRMLGAKVGRGAEIATIANIDPDLLTLEDGSFVADMASVGSATYANGHVAFRRTEVGERAFVGNAAYIPSGTHLGDGSLVGVQSVPPVTGVAPGTSWLGSPSIYLPARELYDEFTEETTFAPSKAKVTARLVIEFVRMTLPSTLLALSTFGMLMVLSFLALVLPMWAMALVVPVLALAFGLGVVLAVAAMKWAIVGRYHPRVKPLWSWFVRRTEFVTGVYEGAAVPALLDSLVGTPMLGPVMRLFGVKVGKRSLLGTTYLTEFDLVRIGDDVAVGPEVSLQTHLFEDRVMKMGEIHLEREVTLGCRAIVLYGTVLEQGVSLAPLSLIMKGERVPARTRWAGIPSRIAPRALRPKLIEESVTTGAPRP